MRLIGIGLLWIFCASGAAPGKPDFSGAWTLNLLRSEYGGQPAPKKMTQNIQHKDPKLKIDTVELSPLDQEVRQTAEYTTDGKERSNTILGNQVKSTAKWEGDMLAIHSWSTFNGRTVDLKDRWRLVQAGSAIIIDRTIEGPAGKFSQVIFLDKQ